MSITFRDRIWAKYPVPRNLSIWGGDNVTTYPIEDLDALITSMLAEAASDIFITAYFDANSMQNSVPSDCVKVLSAKLGQSFPFQGNRLVKFTFDASSRILYLRYFPASVTYYRHLTEEDLDTIQGDRLNYLLCYVLAEMAQKELIYLRSVNMSVDNATIDLAYLQAFADQQRARFEALKLEILPYGSVV